MQHKVAVNVAHTVGSSWQYILVQNYIFFGYMSTRLEQLLHIILEDWKNDFFKCCTFKSNTKF